VGGAFLVHHRLDPVRGWTLASLLALYGMHGAGRAAFESTLRASIAVLYPVDRAPATLRGVPESEAEGAFASVILFNGLGSVASHGLAGSAGGFSCRVPGPRCARYRDGSLHRVDAFASLLVALSVVATLGYARAWRLVQRAADFGDDPSASSSSRNAPEDDDQTRPDTLRSSPSLSRLVSQWGPARFVVPSYQAVENELAGTELRDMT
jgi:hypothetical protein